MDFIVETEEQRAALVYRLASITPPFTVSISEGKHRTLAQNRLQRQWMQDVSKETGFSPEELRGYCKLHFGVPILREENEVFREKYDAILKNLPYQSKIAIMMEPLDLPVTRIMTVSQKKNYLDKVYWHFTGQGYELTSPEEITMHTMSKGAGQSHGPWNPT